MSTNFVYPEEMEYFIESIRPFQVADVGSKKWFDVHEMIIKLTQQSILEAAEHREEEVKELLLSRDKLKVLIHEAYCINIWKTRVLPRLLEINPNPQATFLIYTVLFHEGSVVALLDTALFHGSACEALQDSALDLVDYCAQSVAQLIGLVNMGYHENDTNIDVDESTLSELERQKRDMFYKIGLRCISLLNYLADNHASLPSSATRRMVTKHDIPWLMVDILHFRPWQRKNKRGIQVIKNEEWVNVEGDELAKVNKIEAQAWFCLRQLLFNQDLMQNYDLNLQRRRHLARCQGLLNDIVLDQLPPLVELKRCLCEIGVGAGGGDTGGNKKSNLILEEVPEIRENLMLEADRAGGFVEIAQRQESIFLIDDKEKIVEMATRMNSAYNTELLTDLMDKEDALKNETSSNSKDEQPEASTAEKSSDGNDSKFSKCNICQSLAEKKCGNCKQVFYCSRKCQMADWPQHKNQCLNA